MPQSNLTENEFSDILNQIKSSKEKVYGLYRLSDLEIGIAEGE